MEVTLRQIKALHPCEEGLEWYKKNAYHVTDLEELLLKINEHYPLWARWLFTHLMSPTQCVKIAVFAAKQVLHLFENKHPSDKRPRRAIEVADTWLKTPEDHATAYAAYAAATAAYTAYAAYAAETAADAPAYAAATAAYAAYTAHTTTYAADAPAYAAAYADYTADYTADATAYAAAAYAQKDLQIKIIKEAVKILED